jgi:hypothetical protein
MLKIEVKPSRANILDSIRELELSRADMMLDLDGAKEVGHMSRVHYYEEQLQWIGYAIKTLQLQLSQLETKGE